ncbi:aldehyde dehydrogenase family protein [Paraburkholderia silviterrae]|uniref:Aldehyde dehydrogenase family protein n=1 Tax=Paraburkholderia silviterrae TaxID=2528715 RepID=A0A4R5LXJ2_9BURK|nr:aldehyde dehydrogenase family protein [Paraburkholderia silviterrae]TDG16732.1 aldehyde dehydrogenase family protein [Paraburkholderia silviterrae]
MASQLRARHWIGGEWVDAPDVAESVDPASGETIGTYTEATGAMATRAIAVARKAFSDTDWRENRRLRAKALNEMAERFEARTRDLVEILMLENGKVRAEAEFEVTMVPSKLRFYAALALTDFGRAVETAPGRYATTLREPAGVAGIIAPWNSPVVLFIRSLAPALAAGCTTVGKLPGFTAQTNTRMCEVFSEVASLPAGVVNVFTEAHSAGARVLIDSPDVPVISLTGSSKTGRAIMASCAANMKRFGGELGGKTPMLLFEDADLDAALPKLEKALTVFAGQFCMTGSRLLVHRSILDIMREYFAARLEAVKVGPAADPSSDMGPMINLANVDRVEGMVEAAIAAGAAVVVRGGPFRDGPLARGAFYRPTLLEINDQAMPIAQEEVFGPVLVMQAFDSEDEAVALANQSQYGLAASVWSTDVDRPQRIARQLQAGTVWINNWAIVYDETEEGGYKQSGLGRLNGVSAIDDFVEYRTVIHEIALGATHR